jgi:hypothetical protein
MFLTADGESGRRFGNETIRVEGAGHLTMKVPDALAGQFGAHLTLTVPVEFHHKQQMWADRGRDGLLCHVPDLVRPGQGPLVLIGVVGRPETRARSDGLSSYVLTSGHLAKSGKVLAVDLNEGHLAAWAVDPFGTLAQTLQQQTQQDLQASVPSVSGHHATAVAIGRRAHTLGVKRKRNGPRHGQRTMRACRPPASPPTVRAHGQEHGQSHRKPARGCPVRPEPVHASPYTVRGANQPGLTPA